MAKLNYRIQDDRTLQAFEASTCDAKRDLWAGKNAYRPRNGRNSNVAAVRSEQAFKYMEELRRYEKGKRQQEEIVG